MGELLLHSDPMEAVASVCKLVRLEGEFERGVFGEEMFVEKLGEMKDIRRFSDLTASYILK